VEQSGAAVFEDKDSHDLTTVGVQVFVISVASGRTRSIKHVESLSAW
jgi:hypothetical protein